MLRYTDVDRHNTCIINFIELVDREIMPAVMMDAYNLDLEFGKDVKSLTNCIQHHAIRVIVKNIKKISRPTLYINCHETIHPVVLEHGEFICKSITTMLRMTNVRHICHDQTFEQFSAACSKNQADIIDILNYPQKTDKNLNKLHRYAVKNGFKHVQDHVLSNVTSKKILLHTY